MEKLSRRFIYYLLILANVLINEEEIRNTIKNIFFEVFPSLTENDFSWKLEQKDYNNWDSFSQLNLITLTEAKFEITLTLDESINIKSADDLFKCVLSHVK